MVLDGKSSQEYLVNPGAPQGSILGPTFFLLYINDLPDDFICNIAMYAVDTTLYSKCDQTSDLWQQLELVFELEFNLQDTGLGQEVSALLFSILEKLSLFCLASLITLALLMWKWIGLFLRKNNLLRCWGCLSTLNWIEALTLSLLLKLPPRKLESWFIL